MIYPGKIFPLVMQLLLFLSGSNSSIKLLLAGCKSWLFSMVSLTFGFQEREIYD
jgi:hypothetical protein